MQSDEKLSEPGLRAVALCHVTFRLGLSREQIVTCWEPACQGVPTMSQAWPRHFPRVP